jgi:hypothetical protein
MATDTGLATLLDLNDSIIAQERGCWVKIEAWEVPKSDEMPHGVRYCLTPHDRHGSRILGYDYAHATKPAKKGFAGRRLEYDHRHRHARDKGVPYTFEGAYQLLADFFCEVDTVLKEMNE